MFRVCLGRGEGCCGSDPGPVPAEHRLPQSYPHASKVRWQDNKVSQLRKVAEQSKVLKELTNQAVLGLRFCTDCL